MNFCERLPPKDEPEEKEKLNIKGLREV